MACSGPVCLRRQPGVQPLQQRGLTGSSLPHRQLVGPSERDQLRTKGRCSAARPIVVRRLSEVSWQAIGRVEREEREPERDAPGCSPPWLQVIYRNGSTLIL